MIFMVLMASGGSLQFNVGPQLWYISWVLNLDFDWKANEKSARNLCHEMNKQTMKV
jgi:hypothetical protein